MHKVSLSVCLCLIVCLARLSSSDVKRSFYRGAAHSLCNMQHKIPSYIPVVFHNLSGYDAHLFIKGLADCGSEDHSLSPGVWQSFVTIRSCNCFVRIVSTYVGNFKKK